MSAFTNANNYPASVSVPAVDFAAKTINGKTLEQQQEIINGFMDKFETIVNADTYKSIRKQNPVKRQFMKCFSRTEFDRKEISRVQTIRDMVNALDDLDKLIEETTRKPIDMNFGMNSAADKITASVAYLRFYLKGVKEDILKQM